MDRIMMFTHVFIIAMSAYVCGIYQGERNITQKTDSNIASFIDGHVKYCLGGVTPKDSFYQGTLADCEKEAYHITTSVRSIISGVTGQTHEK